MTTDAQAALAAATQVMVAMIQSSNYGDDKTPYQIEQHTSQMADGFMRWLQRRAALPPTGRRDEERLIPNEDFASPCHARTERIDPAAVLAAATGPTMPIRTVHAVDPIQRTPSGKFACLCGESWPCSQREGAPG